MFGSLGMPELVVVLAIVLIAWPFWRICARAGFSGWNGLLFLVPIINIAAILFLAFAEWPIHRELKALKERRPEE